MLRQLGTNTATLSNTFVRPTVTLAGTGIDYTGVADSTTAIQALIDAAPQGAWIQFQEGVIKFSNLTFDKGKRPRGTGFQFYRDATTTFGDSAYLDNQWFKGTVLRSTATSGVAITLLDTFVTGAALRDLILVGPGTGTSEGIRIGSTTIGVIDPDINVYVCNFSVGVRTRNVNEGTLKIRTRGCVTGAIFETSTNNVKIDLDNQQCTTGASTDSSTLALTFMSPISQKCSDTGLVINGTAHVIINPYHESNNGNRSIDFVSGSRHTLITPSLNTTPDTVRVQSACTNVRIFGMTETRLHDEVTSSSPTIVDVPRRWKLIAGTTGTTGQFTGTVATDGTLTASAVHGLVVGQTVTFTSLPGPSAGGSPGYTRGTATYYVVSVPTTTTFTLSATSGGTAITTGITAGSWTAYRGVGYQNSWTNVSGKTSKYRLTPDGQHVEISAWVTGGTASTVAFTLPLEFRPYSARWSTLANTSQGTGGIVQIASSGAVTVYAGIAGDQRAIDIRFAIDKDET